MTAATRLRICEFNVENLFISMEYYQGETLERLTEEGWRSLALAQLRRRQKPLAKVLGVAKAILDIDADIVMLVEVGGRDSLENLNRHFLGDRYEVFFLEGNSRRAIDLGFLVRRGLAERYRVEAISNRETPVEVATVQGKYVSRFSRDVAELRLFAPAGGESPALILLLVHLKSKLSTEKDLSGKDVRTAEAIALAQFYQNLRERLPDVPIVLGGDFNAELSSLELELLKRTDLADFHDLIATPDENRVSLVHFGGSDGGAHRLVLDYLLVSPHLVDRVVADESYTYRYKGFYDLPEPLPATLKQRHQMASDHYPVVLTVEMNEKTKGEP